MVIDTETKPRSLESAKTLLLNGDYTPRSVFPPSLLKWQDTMKLIFEDNAVPISYYDDVFVRTQRREFQLPSVIALKRYIKPNPYVPFTRYNVYLRDDFTCQYCGFNGNGSTSNLNFDHVIPHSKGGPTTWENISTSCLDCNLKKGSLSCSEAKMWPRIKPYAPDSFDLAKKARKFPPKHLHESWMDYFYWDTELEP